MSEKGNKASQAFLKWFGKLMRGRYGADNFSRFLSGVALVILAVAFLTRTKWLFIPGLLIILCYYYRFFSKNHEARKKENIRYLTLEFKVIDKWKKYKQKKVENPKKKK